MSDDGVPREQIAQMILDGHSLVDICQALHVHQRYVLAEAFMVGKRLRPDLSMGEIVNQVMREQRKAEAR